MKLSCAASPQLLLLSALMLLSASASAAEVSASAGATSEADASAYATKAILAITSPAGRTIDKALELCEASSRNLFCAWVATDPATGAVTNVACMDELRRECGRQRLGCASCGSCNNATWPVTPECHCMCGDSIVPQRYQCQRGCDGKMDCSTGYDENACPNTAIDTTWFTIFDTIGPLIRWIIGLAFWALVAIVFVLVYRSCRARGRCGGPSPQQQQQVASNVPLLIQQQPQPQQPQPQQPQPQQQQQQPAV